MHLENSVKLDFKDVLIRPKRSTLTSRSEVDITREFKFLHSSEPYHGIPIIAADSGLWAMALMMLVVNARYLLMSCALSQRLSPDTPLPWRLLIAYDLTDEIFGLAIAQPGYLEVWYYFRSRRDPLCLHRRRQRLHGGVRRLREEGSRNLSRHRADGGQRRHGRHD